MTVCGRSFMRKTWPTILGSPPKLRIQYWCDRTRTASAPCWSSPFANVRPRMGFTPMRSKKCAETTPVWTRSGSGRPRSTNHIEWYSAIDEKL